MLTRSNRIEGEEPQQYTNNEIDEAGRTYASFRLRLFHIII